MKLTKSLAAIITCLMFASFASADLLAEFNYNAEFSPGNASTGNGTSFGSSFPFTSALPLQTGSPNDMNPVMVNGGSNNAAANRSGPAPGDASGARDFGVNVDTRGFEAPEFSFDILAGYRTSRYYQITATTDNTAPTIVWNPVPAGVGSSVSGTYGTVDVSASGLVTVTTVDGLIDDNTGTGYIPDVSFTFPAGTAYDNNEFFSVRLAAVWDPNGSDFVSSFAGTDVTDTAAGFIRDTSMGGNQVRYDLVQINAQPIPEPAGLALLAGCGFGLLGFRRRRS